VTVSMFESKKYNGRDGDTNVRRRDAAIPTEWLVSSGHYPYHKDIHPSLLYGTLPARGSTVLLVRVSRAEVEVDRRSTDRIHGVSCSYREIAVTGVILPYFL